MARTIEVPSPEPDDPIFTEGFTISSARLSKGPAASEENEADREGGNEKDESAD
jgi:hypothetical protein